MDIHITSRDVRQNLKDFLDFMEEEEQNVIFSRRSKGKTVYFQLSYIGTLNLLPPKLPPKVKKFLKIP